MGISIGLEDQKLTPHSNLWSLQPTFDSAKWGTKSVRSHPALVMHRARRARSHRPPMVPRSWTKRLLPQQACLPLMMQALNRSLPHRIWPPPLQYQPRHLANEQLTSWMLG